MHFARVKNYSHLLTSLLIIISISSDFIPNDTKLGDGDANIILLTGPNMGIQGFNNC